VILLVNSCLFFIAEASRLDGGRRHRCAKNQAVKRIIASCFILLIGLNSAAFGQFAGQGGVPYAQLGQKPGANSQTGATRPHPAVARIIVPERDGTSYGSGTLVDVRDQYGLVVTNWHVVRDATDRIEVVFPDGFRSYGQALKVDKDWDLAALVIWKPNASPVPLANSAPQPGDVLTIAGYGKGTYRALRGNCTQYLSPTVKLPREMVEVSVAARQGDSGGPIFNSRGELAGVLWGAGSATTLGSYVGRVGGFLTSVAPHIGTAQQPQTQIAARLRDAPPIRTPLASNGSLPGNTDKSGGQNAPYGSDGEISDGLVDVDASLAETNPNRVRHDASNILSESEFTGESTNESPSAYATIVAAVGDNEVDDTAEREFNPRLKSPVFRTQYAAKTERTGKLPPTAALTQGEAESANAVETVVDVPLTWHDIAGESYFDQAKTIMAGLGLLAVVLFLKRNMGS
jgi:hypothetical protein